MKFCSECGREIALQEYNMVEMINNQVLCKSCAKKFNEEDLLLMH